MHLCLLIFCNYFLNIFCAVINIYGGLNDIPNVCTGNYIHQLKLNSESDLMVLRFVSKSNFYKNHHFCHFKVKAAIANMGIHVVINKLKLDTERECRNYIQFRAKNSTITEKICNRSLIFKGQKYDFKDPHGEIEVIIYIGGEYPFYATNLMDIDIMMYINCVDAVTGDFSDVWMCDEAGCIINDHQLIEFTGMYNRCPFKKCNCNFSTLKLISESKWYEDYYSHGKYQTNLDPFMPKIKEKKKNASVSLKYMYNGTYIILAGITSLSVFCVYCGTKIKSKRQEISRQREVIINPVPPETTRVPHNLPTDINTHNNQEDNTKTDLDLKPPDYENLPQPPPYETLFT